MKLVGQQFTNSPTCKGLSFAGDAPLDVAEITIMGRYPEQGWARNTESHEMVRVLSGRGSLLLQDSDATKLVEADVVHVPPNAWFAWHGEMTILMACSPSFSKDQYEIRGDD